MDIKTITAACIAALAFAPAGEAADIKFDQVLDLKQFLASAREAELPAPAPPRRSHNGHIHFTRDCAPLTLGPGPGTVESAIAELTSQKYIEECKPLPAGDSGLIIEHCYNQPLEEWTRAAKLRAKPRLVPAGKKETFQVCLEGEKLELDPVSVFNNYTVAREGETEVLFTLTPSEEPVPAEKKAP